MRKNFQRNSYSWLLIVGCCVWNQQSILFAQTDAGTETAKPATQTSSVEEDKELYAIGALGASYAYTSYSYIGVIADNYVFKVEGYDSKRVKDMLSQAEAMLAINISSLQAINKASLNKDDEDTIKGLVTIYKLLKEESDYLKKFIDSNSEDDAKAFERTRQEAWRNLKTVLGIDDRSGATNDGTNSGNAPQK